MVKGQGYGAEDFVDNANLDTEYAYDANGNMTWDANTYDELGRLQTKKVGNGIETTNYAYNIRSWLTGITGSRFTEGLLYNANTGNVVTNFTPSYNGNIAAMRWSIPSENLGYDRTYAFTYDGLNRLTNSIYGGYNGSVVSTAAGKYTETIYYDSMGNISELYRYENGTALNSLMVGATYGQMIMAFDLTKVPAGRYGAEDFVDNANLDTEYAYDANGNMTWDANSKISTIQYNLLNLPDVMQFTDGHQNYYTYSASGQKLNLTNYTLNSIVNVPQGTVNPVPTGAYVKTVTDYVGNMIYQNGSLKMILTPEGYIQNGVYYYYLKDHLGNTRVVINSNGTIIEKSHYYPTGMRFYTESTSYSAAIPFRYGGKEMEAMNGLNQYDFIARRKFSWGGITTTPDPLCEETPWESPYAWCHNSPINNVDPDGKWVWAAIGAALDYGFQVYDNYKAGKSGYDAWVGNVNFVSVGLSAVNPVGKLKILKTVAVEATKATVSVSANEGVKINTDVKDVAEKTVVNTAVGVGASKLTKASSNEAMQNANKEVTAANKQLKTAERQAHQSPNSAKKAENVNNAQNRVFEARGKQVRTEMLNSTVGKAPADAVNKAANAATGRILKDDEKK